MKRNLRRPFVVGGSLCLIALVHCTQTNPAPLAAPTNHRIEATACAVTPGASDAGIVACVDDTPCATVGSAAQSCLHGQCAIDQCIRDADCPAGLACSCQGSTIDRGYVGVRNACIVANCRVDADCGAGGFCSPTFSASCGPVYGVQGYYCHTASDTCSNDADCSGAGSGGAYCTFDTNAGHWLCGGQRCTG